LEAVFGPGQLYPEQNDRLISIQIDWFGVCYESSRTTKQFRRYASTIGVHR
jgi:hypothetical protein